MSGYNLEIMEEAERYNRFLLDLVLPLTGKGEHVLDFGAGSGTFASRLQAYGVDVSCVEPDPVLRRALESKKLKSYETLGALAGESIDLAYSFNVLEHIEDDAAALAALRRVLRPGGRLVLYVPAFMALYSAMDRRIGHLRRYRKKGLSQRVAAAGFSVEGARYADSLGFLAALAFKALGPRSGELDARAVRLYDRWLFPVSRALDRVLGPVLGKNLIVRARR